MDGLDFHPNNRCIGFVKVRIVSRHSLSRSMTCAPYMVPEFPNPFLGTNYQVFFEGFGFSCSAYSVWWLTLIPMIQILGHNSFFENRLKRGRCPRVYMRMVKSILRRCETLGSWQLVCSVPWWGPKSRYTSYINSNCLSTMDFTKLALYLFDARRHEKNQWNYQKMIHFYNQPRVPVLWLTPGIKTFLVVLYIYMCIYS